MLFKFQSSLFLVVICIGVGRGLAEEYNRNWLSCFTGKFELVKAIAYINSDSVKGTVTFTQDSCILPVTVQVSLTGLTPGDHGFHVHEKGDMSAGCGSMLAHYNPDKKTHGGIDDEIRHVGDLGNIRANADGVAIMTIVDNYITLSGGKSIIGRGLVIHERMDDEGKGGAADSLTTGNAGSRIGCGVIGYM